MEKEREIDFIYSDIYEVSENFKFDFQKIEKSLKDKFGGDWIFVSKFHNLVKNSSNDKGYIVKNSTLPTGNEKFFSFTLTPSKLPAPII